MTPMWQAVDDALDVMFAKDPTLRSFDRSDIHAEIGGTLAQVSIILQEHRRAQKRGVTRYVIAARDYARAARWYVLAAPGPSVGGRRRLTMAHVEHIAIDAARRVMSDLRSELDPALVNHPVIQAYLVHAGANLASSITTTVASVESAIALVESLTAETADRSGVKTV